ncbi:MbnP family protein [Flexithrix dorotheae]|uniref:MbnP family protein n=1 Tax=Flexithrix dorotheae TaxID=70993 RepID=UPI00036BFC4D|nr:MbnP family protein [Flexithrix dorotheae]
MKKYTFGLIILTVLLFNSCEKDNNEPSETGSLKLIISHLNDGAPLELETREYTNEMGNNYTISEFKFYLSNIKLRNKSNGKFYIEPESYHLVRRLPDTHQFELTIENVPLGEFNELEFAVGVDNSKNYSLDNVGDLDPSNNMAWDWNSGYKFLLLEGEFFPENEDKKGLVFHIGSDANYRKILLPTGTENINIKEAQTTTIQLEVEVSEIFKDPTSIDFKENNVVMFDAISNKVADNYAKNMFSLIEISE